MATKKNISVGASFQKNNSAFLGMASVNAGSSNPDVGTASALSGTAPSTIPLSNVSRGLSLKADTVLELPRSFIVDADIEKDVYPVLRGLDELAMDIAQRGIQNPLTVVPAGDGRTYIVTSGHRRLHAYDIACEKYGLKNGGVVRCILSNRDASKSVDIVEDVILNNLQRNKTDYERMMEIIEFKKSSMERKRAGEKISSVRSRVKERIGVSDTMITRAEKIYESLIPDLMIAFRDELIASTVAYDIANLSKGEQAYISAHWDRSEPLQAKMVTVLIRKMKGDDQAESGEQPRARYIPATISEGFCELQRSMSTIAESIQEISAKEGGLRGPDRKRIIKRIGDYVERARALDEELRRIQAVLSSGGRDEE